MNLNITPKDVLTIQNKTHVLKETTNKTFKTNRFESLKAYVKDFVKENSLPVSAYYDTSEIVVWQCIASTEIVKHQMPIASCKFEETDEFKLLKQRVNINFDEKEFCKFLQIISKYSLGAIKLKEEIENMKINKMVSMSKSKDSRGNCSYQYSIKDSRSGDFVPPSIIFVQIPICKHIDSMIKFDLRLLFEYHTLGVDSQRRVSCGFKLEKSNFEQYVESALIGLIEKQLNEFKFPKYWGSLHKETYTDEWKYKDVPLTFKGLPENITNIENKKGY